VPRHRRVRAGQGLAVNDKSPGQPLGTPPANGYKPLPIDDRIVDLLKGHDGPAGICPSLGKLAGILGVTRRYVRKRIAEMEAGGRVERKDVFETQNDPEWQRRGWEINHPRAQTNSTYRLASYGPRVPTPLGTPTNPVGNAVSPAQPLGTQPFANGPRVPPYKETVEQVVGTGGVDEGEPASPHDGAGQGVDGGEIAEPPTSAEPRRKRGGGRPAKEREAAKELVTRLLADGPRLGADLREATRDVCCSRTLHEVRVELRVQSVQIPEPGRRGPGRSWCWLPERPPSPAWLAEMLSRRSRPAGEGGPREL
jgi:hypothetical protein